MQEVYRLQMVAATSPVAATAMRRAVGLQPTRVDAVTNADCDI